MTERDHRRVVREGRRPARADGAGHQGLRRDGRRAQRRASCQRLHIRRACEDSLRRLQTDHIDLYQMHHVDRDTPWDEIWQAMELLVDQGKVLYVGSSNFAGWDIAEANEAAASAQPARARVASRPSTTCMTREVELEVLPAAASTASASSRGARCTAVCSAARSGSEGRRRQAGHGPRRLWRPTGTGSRAYEKLCADTRREAGQRGPGLAAPRRGDGAHHRAAHHGAAGRVAASRRADARRRDPADELDRIFPGYKPAPEHYAW